LQGFRPVGTIYVCADYEAINVLKNGRYDDFLKFNYRQKVIRWTLADK
jgi:hypothetical protein